MKKVYINTTKITKERNKGRNKENILKQVNIDNVKSKSVYT